MSHDGGAQVIFKQFKLQKAAKCHRYWESQQDPEQVSEFRKVPSSLLNTYNVGALYLLPGIIYYHDYCQLMEAQMMQICLLAGQVGVLCVGTACENGSSPTH